MKKSVLYFAVLVCMMVQTLSASANERIISAEQLPASVISFIEKFYPGQDVSYAVFGSDFSKTIYEVYLDNGVELEFDESGEWNMVDCVFDAVPASIVPSAIVKFVRKNFPNAKIVKIEKEDYGFDVELSNGRGVRFDYDEVL